MLYGGGASPSLRVPASSASPNGSNVTTTGRPPLWNPSSQRKVSRLYLYTTLSLQKIIEVVHAKSPAPVPGYVITASAWICLINLTQLQEGLSKQETQFTTR